MRKPGERQRLCKAGGDGGAFGAAHLRSEGVILALQRSDPVEQRALRREGRVELRLPLCQRRLRPLLASARG